MGDESEMIEMADKKPKGEPEYFSPLKAPAFIGSNYLKRSTGVETPCMHHTVQMSKQPHLKLKSFKYRRGSGSSGRLNKTPDANYRPYLKNV